MPFVALALAAGLSQLNFDIVDVKIEHRQPSTILSKMIGFSNSEASIYAVDNASLIRIYGPKSEASRIKSFVKLMDIAPQYLSVSATAMNRVTKIVSSFDVKTSNGSIVSLSDSGSKAAFTFTPQIRQDGLISLGLMISCGSTETANIVVCKPGKVYEFAYGPRMLDSLGNDTPESTYVMRVKVSLPISKK